MFLYGQIMYDEKGMLILCNNAISFIYHRNLMNFRKIAKKQLP